MTYKFENLFNSRKLDGTVCKLLHKYKKSQNKCF